MKKIFSALLIILVLAIGIIVVPVVSYISWNSSFYKEIPQMYCKLNITEEISLDDKFKDFVLSDEETTFVRLDPEEVITLLGNTNIINGGEIENLCITTSKGLWKVYAKVNLQGIRLPWFVLDISKDSIESAQLYVSNTYLGNQLLPTKMANGLKGEINRGISDALVLVSENNFLGRTITNIELLEDEIVVKGTI